jgi:hypothetical protein
MYYHSWGAWNLFFHGEKEGKKRGRIDFALSSGGKPVMKDRGDGGGSCLHRPVDHDRGRGGND